MTTAIGPLHLLTHAIAGWMQREKAQVIDLLREENKILRARLPATRLVLTDDERRRLAACGIALGRAALAAVVALVTADTILRGHRELVAARWTTQKKGTPGRPGLMKDIAALIVRFATENPLWGYKRIQGALANVGHRVCANTIGKTRRAHGLDPTPERGKHTQWATFLKSHCEFIAAGDLLTTEVWTTGGLVTHYTLFVIDLATRAVQTREACCGVPIARRPSFCTLPGRDGGDHAQRIHPRSFSCSQAIPTCAARNSCFFRSFQACTARDASSALVARSASLTATQWTDDKSSIP